MSKSQKEVSFLVVVDVGRDRDHSSEVRVVTDLFLDFTPSNRSSARQLREIADRLYRFNFSGCCESADDLHIWLLENGRPTLFVSGLLMVREGRLNKSKMANLEAVLRTQVTSPQQVRPYQFLVGGRLATWQDVDDIERSIEEYEDDIYEEVFGDFDVRSFADSSSDDDVICVEADVWQMIVLELPFEPNEKCTSSQLRYVAQKLNEELEELASDAGAEMVDSSTAWLISDRRPVTYITGLVEFVTGKLSKRRFKAECEEAISCLEAELRFSMTVGGKNPQIILEAEGSSVL